MALFFALLSGLLFLLSMAFVTVQMDSQPKLSALSLESKVGLQFPALSPLEGNWGRLQAMNVVPIQDDGLALQWHLVSWPNSWFERFPLTLDQNLNSARGVHSEEHSYWMSAERLGRRNGVGVPTCPQTNPLTPSPSRIWDSTVSSPGRHLGEVWLSDSMADVNHPDLQGTVFVNESSSPRTMPDNHGTHVAGVMSALRNGEGTVGVVPGLQVRLFPLPVTISNDGPRISGSDVLKNLDEMIVLLLARESEGDKKTRVILLSWSFLESDGLTRDFLEGLETRIRKLLEHDVAVVVPAGNLDSGRKLAGQRMFPGAWVSAMHDSVGIMLPVGALDVCSRPAWFSQIAANEHGYAVMAPGERIFSTLANKDYGYMSGTSAAAAQVAAVLALTAYQYPDVDMKAQATTLVRTSTPMSYGSERLVSFDAPSLIQGLMAEYGWIAHHR